MTARLKHGLMLAITLMGLSCSSSSEPPMVEPTLIPLPQQVELVDDAYKLADEVLVGGVHSTDKELVDLLGEVIDREVVVVKDGQHPHLVLDLGANLEGDAYKLEVSDAGIVLTAATPQGMRYAIQTLGQLTDEYGRVHYAQISDAPRFGYRGIMLDVSRHMVSKQYILNLLTEMARVKLNRFHWHLVDGGGWRMESEAYPLLTKKAAFRTQRDWDKWWGGRDRQFVDEGTPGAYGGYYTKAEIREVVAHATRLGITIIPEIEMPGHSNELFFAYPELFCRSHFQDDITDVCIGNEATFTFFERILDETMDLFPSEYIHIGGDEAAMNHWGDCPRCQARMKQEGLKNLHELQSYMIRRIERYLLSKGRKLIGWDEILMGGLAPEATVMSWRGEAGGIEAAKAGHDVIMTPNSHFYLDYYQSAAPNQPRANSSFVPLEKVYSYNPEVRGLTAQENKHILGVQANLWTEYATTEAEVDYMLYPRMLAVAEVAWTQQERRQWSDFKARAARYTDRLIARGIGAYTLNDVRVDISPSAEGGEVRLELEAERPDAEIRYTLDGSEPTSKSELYTAPLVTSDSLQVRLNLYRSGKPVYDKARAIRLDKHKAMAGKVTYATPWNERYPASGERTLIDGYRGAPTYSDGKWQGFTTPMDVTIDLGSEQHVGHVYAQFMQEREHWVYMPRYVEVWMSTDGKEWYSLGRKSTTTPDDTNRPVFEVFDFTTSQKARYIRLYAENDRSSGRFIFTDEIVVQ